MNTPSSLHTIRRRRRAVLLAFYSICAAGIGVAFAAPGGGAGAGRGPATTNRVVSPADKAAADAQFAKAKDLYDQNKFAEAQVENDKALKLDPAHVNASLLQGLIKSKLAGGPSVTTGTAATTGAAAAGKIPVLTPQQVSVIRLLELGPSDRPAGRVDPKGLEDFWQTVMLADPLSDKSSAAHNAFIAPANFINQVRRIRESHDMKYMEQVTITNEPATFVGYRTNVQAYVLQNCATAECHGGEKSPGGNFHLLSSISSSDPTTAAGLQYTNYYILTQYRNKDGEMIDRESPDKSLLLQYALPWQNAATKHPKIDAKKLTGTNDPRGRNIADWIRSLPIPKPVYGIAYTVPGATAPASAPASAPTSAPAAGK